MFTGLVEELGKVTAISRSAKSVRLTIEASCVLSDAKLGDSIAVNGTCLTVVEHTHHSFTADVMPETVDKTALSQLRPGHKVNLERTLKVGDRLGGHIVSGHVDGIGIIRSKETDDIAVRIAIQTSANILRYIIEKGSIAIDGISLTVVDTGSDWFSVSLIPHTAAMTTLGFKKTGDTVNLETDIIGKYVEQFLRPENGTGNLEKQSGLSWDKLKEFGFAD